MVTTLVVILVILLVAAAVLGYLVERARAQELPAKVPHVIDLRPLPPQRIHDYRAEWVGAQAAFVDDPEGAVRAADALVERLLAERGYPPAYPPDESRAEQAGWSREQSEALHHYWAGHEITVADDHGGADTDALRRAMVHYRMVFSALLESAVPR